MTPPPLPSGPPPQPAARLPLGWLAVALLGGLGCVVLPPFLLPGGPGKPPYGWPLIPWLAFAFTNVRVGPSLAGFLGLGLLLGAAQPRWWWVLGPAAMALTPVLHAVNIAHDWTRDATSHNLFPFEFVMIGFLSCPAFLGAGLGAWLRQRRNAPAA
jgi:hypothetical protein